VLGKFLAGTVWIRLVSRRFLRSWKRTKSALPAKAGIQTGGPCPPTPGSQRVILGLEPRIFLLIPTLKQRKILGSHFACPRMTAVRRDWLQVR
jgi:hypothetical protein